MDDHRADRREDGCAAETLRHWVRQAERARLRSGLTTDERQRLKDLERENRELKRANEPVRVASAFFAKAALDRRAKWSSKPTGRRSGSSRSARCGRPSISLYNEFNAREREPNRRPARGRLDEQLVQYIRASAS